jgi:hypothetical protein
MGWEAEAILYKQVILVLVTGSANAKNATPYRTARAFWHP